jgi:hypothetical protein
MGALASTRDLFVRFDDEETQKNQGRLDRLQLLVAILAQRWRLVASNKALNLFYWVMHAVLYRRTATAIKMASLLGKFFLLSFHLLLPWRPLGRYGMSSCPMAASSGFRSSPGHAASGNAICIAPAHPCGHQNGRRMRCIHLSLSPRLYHIA